MKNETIEALIKAIKEEDVYQNYRHYLLELQKDSDILEAYQKAKQEYMDMRPYFKYQDFSELKNRVQTLSKQVTNLESYQGYMSSLHQLETRLEEITALIFEDVLVEAEETRCVSSLENTNEGI